MNLKDVIKFKREPSRDSPDSVAIPQLTCIDSAHGVAKAAGQTAQGLDV